MTTMACHTGALLGPSLVSPLAWPRLPAAAWRLRGGPGQDAPGCLHARLGSSAEVHSSSVLLLGKWMSTTWVFGFE